jgi:hypothetical protein
MSSIWRSRTTACCAGLALALAAASCGGDDDAQSTAPAKVAADTAASTSSAAHEPVEPRVFACPAAEAVIIDLADADLALERGTSKDPATPAEAEANGVEEVTLCDFSSGSGVPPAMLNVHWIANSGRSAFEGSYEIEDRPGWGEDAFLTRERRGSDSQSQIATATLPYPGGGFWHVVAIVPEASGLGSDAPPRWAEAVGDLAASAAETHRPTGRGTGGQEPADLRALLDAELPDACPAIDHRTRGDGLSVSVEDITTDGIDCEEVAEVAHLNSPALDDDFYQGRETQARTDALGNMSCYIGKPDTDGGVAVACDDGRGARLRMTLVSVPSGA